MPRFVQLEGNIDLDAIEKIDRVCKLRGISRDQFFTAAVALLAEIVDNEAAGRKYLIHFPGETFPRSITFNFDVKIP